METREQKINRLSKSICKNLITRHTKLPNRLVARSIADVKEELDNLTGRVVDVEEAKRRNQLISVLDWLEEINND